MENRIAPTDPNYRPDVVDDTGYTGGHYIRVSRLQEDVCSGNIRGRWLRNQRLGHLLRDYQTGRVAKGSSAMLFFLDHIVMEDDRGFSRGSNKPCPPGLTYALKELGRMEETTDWDVLELEEERRRLRQGVA
jgi:hypothetical protein